MGLVTPPATLRGANGCAYGSDLNPAVQDDDSESVIVVPGWKKRNVGAHGPDTRTPPSTKTAIEHRLLEMNGRIGGEIFEPVVGRDFDSCQEAYDFYNLYSWEHGFGIRRGRSRVNTNKYRLMNDLGKNDKENSSSCKIDCKAMAMECPNCKNPPAVCGDLKGLSCHVSVPMTTFYWVEAFVPCCNRRVLGACIEHLQSIATRENKPMCKTVFQGGFRKYVVQLEMKEDDLVVITFHKRAGTASMTVRVCILS